MGQFRIKTIEHVRTGLLRNLEWLMNEYEFEKDNNNVIPEISKGSITVESGYGPGEYWMSFVDQNTGEKFGFENLWNLKCSGFTEVERKRAWSKCFGDLGDEKDSAQFMTEKIKCELKFIMSEKPEFFK